MFLVFLFLLLIRMNFLFTVVVLVFTVAELMRVGLAVFVYHGGVLGNPRVAFFLGMVLLFAIATF